MGVEGWFERSGSHLCGEAKNHLHRNHFSAGAGANRERIWRRRGISASSAASCAMAAQMMVE